uniref:Uncharacterized protein n=1 Tax=Oryza brachyantha TaxID=4533 RepID=J3LEV0_ORYBR
MSPEKPEKQARGSAHGSSAAGENSSGFCRYFGLLRDKLKAYFDTDYTLTMEEHLADIFASMGEDMDEVLTSEEEFLPGCVTPRMSTRDPKSGGGSFRGHLNMLCDCHYTHAAAPAAAAPSTPPAMAVVIDEADQHPASPDDGSNLLVYMQDEVVAAEAAEDVDQIVLNALGFNEIARDLKEAIEAMDREDAMTATMVAMDMDAVGTETAAPATTDIDEAMDREDA